MHWRAYYTEDDNPNRFDSRATKPEDLPDDGVLGIVKYTGRETGGGVLYRHTLSGDDYYFYWKNEWFSNSDDPKETERRYPGALILRGKWTTDADMQRVIAEMAEAREAP